MANIAFVFPGQGSQSIGMLSELSQAYPQIKSTLSEASEAAGYDVEKLIENGPETQLNQTEFTQVAMLAADVSIFRTLRNASNVQVKLMAGHSLGEYAALVCSESISLFDATKIVQKRGQLMQESIPLGKGAMAAIVGLSDHDVEEICEEASSKESKVTPANYNAIGQVVIAGDSIAVNKAIALAEHKEARMAKIIPVSVPCHCPLLVDAALLFGQFLETTNFSVPNTSVISNVDLTIYHSEQQIKNLLTAQLYSPVRWVETIQKMKRESIDLVIECGPGKVLGGLIKRIDKTLKAISINDKDSLENFLIEDAIL